MKAHHIFALLLVWTLPIGLAACAESPAPTDTVGSDLTDLTDVTDSGNDIAVTTDLDAARSDVQDEGGDASADNPPGDTPSEVLSDTLPDAPSDIPADPGSDAYPDITPDVTPDTVTDTNTDTDTDTSPPATVDIPLTATKLSAASSGELLVTNGVPMAPGVLTGSSDIALFDGSTELAIYANVLATWPDGSARSVLLQFARDAADFPTTLTLRLGAQRTTEDRTAAPIPTTLPDAVAFPDADYLTASRVRGRLTTSGGSADFATYDSQAQSAYDNLKGDGDWGPDCRADGYYSTTLSWYTLFARTADPEVFSWARREAVHYRDDQIVQTGADAGKMDGRSEPRYLYLQAMEADYLLTGDPKTLSVSKLMVDYLLANWPASWFHYEASDEGFWTERRAAFPLLGLLVYGRFSNDDSYLQATHAIVDNLLATQDEWPDGGWVHHLYAHDTDECGTFGSYGGSPFMTGLLFEALIAYWEQFADPRIPTAIAKATDWLWTGWGSIGFSYLIGCPGESLQEGPDLNLLIAHGFAFQYWLSDGADTQAKTRAETVFDAGVEEGYLGTRKHYNQQYRSSGAVPYYLTAPAP